MIRALLVDDEAAEARMLRRAVRASRGVPDIDLDDCRSARAALNRLRDRSYDAVIVDRGLQDMDGLELGRRMRRAGHARGLIMLTGRYTRPEDERAAFAAGFDDFVRKPADPLTLLARIAAVVRRSGPPGGHRASPAARGQREKLADEALEVSTREPIVVVFSRPVPLTPLKWRILRALYVRRGHAVPWAVLASEAWETDPPADAKSSIRKHTRGLRLALGEEGPRLVETVRGYGVRLRFWNCK